MKKLSTVLMIISSSLLCSEAVHAAIPNTSGNPTTFLGPIGRLGFTTVITDTSAASVAGEAGPRNYRIGGTIGWTDMGSNRFKFSAEYLWQNINYSFFTGNTYQWVSQGALGADYQYLFEDYEYNPQFDFNAYISNAPSKSLSSSSGSYVNSTGETTSFTDLRRIAGSNAYGVNPGFNLTPWDGGNIGLNVNYDNVRYRNYYTPKVHARGLGGTAHFNQLINEQAGVELIAAVRKPFNNYQANLDLTFPTSYGTWLLGLNAAYTIGKESLPSTYNIGLSADYLLDQTDTAGMTQRQATQSFLGWVAKPAVYMPQVLAIADGEFCIPPAFIGTLGTDIHSTNPGYYTPLAATSIAGNFTGNNLRYTLNLNKNTNAGSFKVTQNGVISDPTGNARIGLSITARNNCGSATSNLFDLGVTA